jgi:hypothetical protein
MSGVRGSLVAVGGSLFNLSLSSSGPATPPPVISGPIGLEAVAPAQTTSTPEAPARRVSSSSLLADTEGDEGSGGPAGSGSDTALAGSASPAATAAAAAAAAAAAMADELGVRGSYSTGYFQENFWGDTEAFAGYTVLSNHMRRSK